jgi:hypothetical protein
MFTLEDLLQKFFGTLFGMNKKLSGLERSVLDSVGRHLSEDMRIIWEKQINTINKVQRLPGWREVNFYRMKKGHPVHDESLEFPNKTKELLIAEVRVKWQGFQNTLIACVWSVKGILFSIEYSGEDARYFAEATGMDPPAPLEFICEMRADLSVPQT